MHNAAAKLTASVAARVSSVVMFGDPDDGEDLANGLQSKSLTICHDGELWCWGTRKKKNTPEISGS